jgi:hypothetical protein
MLCMIPNGDQPPALPNTYFLHPRRFLPVDPSTAASQVPVCISQCLAHMLFMVANGDQTPTALPDTFGTPYFVRLVLLLVVPPEFVQDMQQRWGTTIEPGSRVFDLFRWAACGLAFGSCSLVELLCCWRCLPSLWKTCSSGGVWRWSQAAGR